MGVNLGVERVISDVEGASAEATRLKSPRLPRSPNITSGLRLRITLGHRLGGAQAKCGVIPVCVLAPVGPPRHWPPVDQQEIDLGAAPILHPHPWCAP